jgi:hypothetical protein
MVRTFNAFANLDAALRMNEMKAEWRLRPMSNTDRMTAKSFLSSWDHKRSVEVFLQEEQRGLVAARLHVREEVTRRTTLTRE